MQDDEEESLRLLSMLSVKETYFHREPAHLKMLAEHLMPKIVFEKKPVRVLSAGCASGEEPYSVAIELMERFGSGIAPMLQVTGVDIDAEALALARKGKSYDSVVAKMDILNLETYEKTIELNQARKVVEDVDQKMSLLMGVFARGLEK